MAITHAFVSPKADSTDTTIVRPSNWNAAHSGTATPDAHKASHQNDGADEVSVTALSGLLADDQHVLDEEVTTVAVAHALATAASDFLVASGAGAFIKKTLAETRTLLGLAVVTAWATYVPTITSGIGTHTTITATGRWRLIGDTMQVKVSVLITDKGTAAGYMIASLPSGYTQAQGISVALTAAEVARLGNTGLSWIDNGETTFYIGTYLGGTPWTDTYVWIASGEFKVTS